MAGRRHWEYYRRWISHTCGRSWAISGTVAGVMRFLVPGFLIPLAQEHFPMWEASLLNLTWEVPFWVFVGLSIGRLFLAPYWIDQEREQEILKLKKSHQKDEGLLRQQIIDLEDQLTIVKTPTEEQISAAVNASFVSKKVTDFHIEDNAVVITLPSPPIPNTFDLFITNGHYNLLNSPGMSIRGNKIYLKNIDKPRELRFFDVLPLEIPEGSVSVRYYPSSVEENARARHREQQETFARLIEEGTRTRNVYNSLEPVPPDIAQKWEAKVCTYLEQTLGSAAVFQFKEPASPYLINIPLLNRSEENHKCYVELNTRLTRLNEITENLGD